MAHRMAWSPIRRIDRIVNNGLFTGKFKILAQVQPKRLELGQFLSQLSAHPPPNPRKGFDNPFGPKQGSKSVAFTAAGIGTDPKSTSLSGGGEGPEADGEKSSGGPNSGDKNKRQILVALSTAGILGVGWWIYCKKNKDFNWKGIVDNFLGGRTVDCASAITDGNNKRDDTLQGSRDVPLQEITGDENETQSVPANLAQLVNAANSTDPQIQYDAIKSVRKLVSADGNRPIDSLINCNVLPTLVNCLSSQNPALQYEALWALTNIADGTSQQTQAIVQAGAVPHLLKLLTSPHENIRENAVGALGNIISHGPQIRDYVISLGFVAPLLNCIQPGTPITFLSNIAWVISNLCGYKDVPLPPETLREILPALSVLVDHKDTEVLVETLWALVNFTFCGKEQIQSVINSGVLPKLILLLNHPEAKVQKVAVRAVGNIFLGSDDQTQVVLNCIALSHFHNLLNHPNEKICWDALLVLSFVTARNQVQAVIDAGLIPLLVHHLEKGKFTTQKAAARAVFSMTIKGNEEQLTSLINCGVIPPLCNLLDCKDSEVIQDVLDGIYNILQMSVNQDGGEKACTSIEECGGLDKIESLQHHENIEIYKTAFKIIEKYFSDEVEEGGILLPEAAENAG